MRFNEIGNDEVRRWFEDPAAPQEVNGTVKVAIPIDGRFSQALCARKHDGELPDEFGWLCLIDREAGEIYDLEHLWGREALCMDFAAWEAAVEASRGNEVFEAFEEAVASGVRRWADDIYSDDAKRQAALSAVDADDFAESLGYRAEDMRDRAIRDYRAGKEPDGPQAPDPTAYCDMPEVPHPAGGLRAAMRMRLTADFDGAVAEAAERAVASMEAERRPGSSRLASYLAARMAADGFGGPKPTPLDDRAREVSMAMMEVFGGKPPKTVGVTFTRSGRSMTVKCDYAELSRCLARDPGDLVSYGMTTQAVRGELDEMFGERWMYNPTKFRTARMGALDIEAVAYRGREVYSAPPQVRDAMHETRSVHAEIFAPTRELREGAMADPDHPGRRGFYADGFDPCEHAAGYEKVADFTAQVGVAADRAVGIADALRQWKPGDPQIDHTFSVVRIDGDDYCYGDSRVWAPIEGFKPPEGPAPAEDAPQKALRVVQDGPADLSRDLEAAARTATGKSRMDSPERTRAR